MSRPLRRSPAPRTRPGLECLESRDVPSSLAQAPLGFLADLPARRVDVSILFPVFRPTEYTNPGFRPIGRLVPTLGR